MYALNDVRIACGFVHTIRTQASFMNGYVFTATYLFHLILRKAHESYDIG